MALSWKLSTSVITRAPPPWPNLSSLAASPAIALAHLNATTPRRSHVHAATQGEMSATRRQALLAGGLLPACLHLCSFPSATLAVVMPAKIDPSTAPSRAFDPGDARLREAANLFQKALNASTVEDEEKLWTQVIDKYGDLDAEWVADIVSRAWGNRGNSRSRQGKMEEALADFDRSIALAPYAADPVLNRGVTLESLGRYEEAAADYQAVLLAEPNDPAAWNNLGNVKAALGQYDEALVNYKRAVQLAPEFSFAAANYALLLYQVGKDNEAFKLFRSLLRKYPEFPDVRAALAVALYAQGLTGEAETNWGRLEVTAVCFVIAFGDCCCSALFGICVRRLWWHLSCCEGMIPCAGLSVQEPRLGSVYTQVASSAGEGSGGISRRQGCLHLIHCSKSCCCTLSHYTHSNLGSLSDIRMFILYFNLGGVFFRSGIFSFSWYPTRLCGNALNSRGFAILNAFMVLLS